MRIQKLSLVAALVLGGLLAGSTLASAQTTNEVKKERRGPPSVEQQVTRLAEELKLTDEQKTKVTAVFEERNKKMQALSTEDRRNREKTKPIMDEVNAKMEKILTADQFTKFKTLRQGRGGEKKGEKKTE